MIRIAIPDLLMVEAEFLAFELLTVGSSYFSVAHLAAQSAIATITCVAFLLHFPVSIAASTRIANLIGTASVDAAQMAAKVALVAMTSLGVFNMAILAGFRNYLPLLFTSDPVVVRIASGVLRVCAAFQLFDAWATYCNGVLRGLGRQNIGGWVALGSYYLVRAFALSSPLHIYPLLRFLHGS